MSSASVAGISLNHSLLLWVEDPLPVRTYRLRESRAVMAQSTMILTPASSGTDHASRGGLSEIAAVNRVKGAADKKRTRSHNNSVYDE